jgi:hypothetical protein
MSPTYEGIQWVSFIGLGVWIIFAVFNWVRHRDLTWAVLVVFQIFILLVFWRRVFKPLPSKVHFYGQNIVFQDFPSFWIAVQGFQVPVIIKKEFCIPIMSMTTEWIGGNLTWNDLEKGRSVLLARGKQAHEFEAWLVQQGVSPAVGGK